MCCAEATPSPTPTRARLDALFNAHPRLRAGWQAQQELHCLYTADDSAVALGRFCDHAPDSRHSAGLRDDSAVALGRFCDLYETKPRHGAERRSARVRDRDGVDLGVGAVGGGHGDGDHRVLARSERYLMAVGVGAAEDDR